MRIQFWGVRGSIPAPLTSDEIKDKLIRALEGARDVDLENRRAIKEYVCSLPPLVQGTVGGNTPCVSIQVGDEWLIIDAGSGIRNLGIELMKREFGQGQGTAHILISHTHWDHIQGFPFFRPLFVAGNHITIYSPIPDIERRLQNQQIPDYFPKTIPEFLHADLSFVRLRKDVPASIAGIQVSTILQAHPGLCYGYRLDGEGASVVYASDAEFKSLSQAHTRRYVDFMRDADVLIFDAQYTLGDAFQRVDWGHSSAMIGVELAIQANVKRLMLFHYEHVYNDIKIQEILDGALEYVANDPAQPQCEVQLAMEGMAFELGEHDTTALQERTVGDTVVLSIRGRFDPSAVSRVDEKLAALISNGLRAGLVLDLSETTHLSVAGLKALLNAQQVCQATPIVIAAARENVRQVLVQVGSMAQQNGGPADDTAFAQYDTVKAAVSALEARQYLELQGQMLHSRYRVESTLQISTKAGVFKAFDTWIERPVTIKVLSQSLGNQANQMLLKEARTLARLDHANIVSVYDCVEYQGHLYLVREFIEGETLSRWLERSGTDKPGLFSETIAIAKDILAGLAYAHEHEVIHRYIHPKNVILSGDQAKIMNFGLADHPEEVWSLDKIAYMSPEQLAQRTLSARSDLYSFGVLLYTLLTGQLPFRADAIQELINQCTYAAPVSPSQINREIPAPLERTILNLLAKDPGARQLSARVVLKELEQIASRPAREPGSSQDRPDKAPANER